MNSISPPLSITVISPTGESVRQQLAATFNAPVVVFETRKSAAETMAVTPLPREPSELCRMLAAWDFHQPGVRKYASVGLVEVDSTTIFAAICNTEFTAQIELSYREDWVGLLHSFVESIKNDSVFDPHVAQISRDSTLRQILEGKVGAVAKTNIANETAPVALMPGSFNPFHEGHREMLSIAERILGEPVDLELSAINVDKPPLDHLTVQQRIEKLPTNVRLWLTCSPTFSQKAKVFPRSTFVVGADTIVRVADENYYCGDQIRDQAVEEIATAGCRFLVFGRHTGSRFETLDAIDLPPALRRICQGVSQSDFRVDISSTKLRSDETE